jgi:probable HAF family extracellular repeat protein
MNPMRLLILWSGAALGLLACTSEETATDPTAGARPEMAVAKTYTAVDLGTLETPLGFNTYSFAYDINDAGQVVGQSTALPLLPNPPPRRPSLASHAVLWDKGVITDLGTLGGDYSSATAINPAGVVVGSSLLLPAPRNTGEDAFLWKDGVITDLGTLGGRESVAWDINPRGQVVGTSQIGGGVSEPNVFLWEKGVMTDLGFQPRNSEELVGINPAGRVVAAGKLWTNGVVTELGSLGGCCTSAHAINAAGQVVGLSYLPGSEDYHAFLWEKGVMTDLGTLGGTSDARGINARGQVVGISGNRAFVWEKGVMTELVSLDRRFDSAAFAINAAGDIVGYSNTEQLSRATLWTRK